MTPIKITDGTNVQLKSDITDHVNVHIGPAQYINVVLPDSAILVIEPDGTVTRYEDDNLIGEHRIPSLEERHPSDVQSYAYWSEDTGD